MICSIIHMGFTGKKSVIDYLDSGTVPTSCMGYLILGCNASHHTEQHTSEVRRTIPMIYGDPQFSWACYRAGDV